MSTCNCRTEIEKKLLERFKHQNPDAEDRRVELQGYCLVVTGNDLEARPYMPFKTSAKFPLKKGGTKHKSSIQNMMFNYCPFCGVAVKDGSAS